MAPTEPPDPPDRPETADPRETRDTLLGGRVVVVQRQGGHRAAIDPVLLAAAVPAAPGDTVLDVGSGTGAAALALAARVAGAAVAGLEIDPGLVGLAERGAEMSGLSDRVRFVEGDLLAPPAALEPGAFDHVMANPPYREPGRGTPPKDAARRAATVEGAAGLRDWLRFQLSMVRAGGTVTVIHRFERAAEVAAGLAEWDAGGAVIFPLWPKRAGAGAKRAIVQARKAAPAGAPRTLAGLVLHRDDGAYTDAAEAVLRDAQALRL